MSVFVAFLWGLGAYFVTLLVAGFLPTVDSLSLVGCQAVAYLLVLFGILRVHEPESSIRSVIGLRSTHLGFFPLAIALGVVVNPPLQKLYLVLQRRWPVEETEQLEWWSGLAQSGKLRAGFAIALLAPLLEEVLCRGGLFAPLVRRYDRLTGLVVTSFVFVLLHHIDARVLPILVFALILGFLRSESGSLVPSILAHVTFNLVSIIELHRITLGSPVAWLTAPSDRTVIVAALGTVALVLGVRVLAERSESAKLSRSDDERRTS